MRNFVKLGIFFGLFLVLFSLYGATYAIYDNSSNSDSNTKYKQFKTPETKISTKSAKEKSNVVMVEKKATAAAMRKVKLSEARLKICETRENVIANRFKALLALGIKTHTGKEKIVERVDAFYNNILVPAGYTLPNYNVLKSDIAAKEASVKVILDEVKASGQDFSCNSDDPKGEADLFKQNMQKLIASNKEYKTSVRAFVVAVRDLARKAKTDKLSPSPVLSPVASPEVTEVPVL